MALRTFLVPGGSGPGGRLPDQASSDSCSGPAWLLLLQCKTQTHPERGNKRPRASALRTGLCLGPWPGPSGSPTLTRMKAAMGCGWRLRVLGSPVPVPAWPCVLSKVSITRRLAGGGSPLTWALLDICSHLCPAQVLVSFPLCWVPSPGAFPSGAHGPPSPLPPPQQPSTRASDPPAAQAH